jgi:uncharacterized protein (DUF433 family)
MEVLWGQGVSDVDIFNLSGFGRGVCGNGRGMVPHWARLLKKGKFVTNKDLLEEFKDLERTDILACLAYATASMKLKDIEVPAA